MKYSVSTLLTHLKDSTSSFFQSFRWQLSLELGSFHVLKMNLSWNLDLSVITDTFLYTIWLRITNTLKLKILWQITTVI